MRKLHGLPAATELIVAGFPCQDLSQAGKTAGIEGRSSSLVGEVIRLLRSRRQARRPIPLVLFENVPFMLHLARGRALEVIISALEELGYRWAYRVVDTMAFGLPQRRERVFLVAALDEDPRGILFADRVNQPPPQVPSPSLSYGFYWTEGLRGLGTAVDAVPTLKGGSTIGIPSPPAIVLPSGDVVLPSIEDAERLQGFEEGWTSPAHEGGRPSLRWRLVGNAVSVPVAQWLGGRLADPGHPFEDSWAEPVAKNRSWPRAAWNCGGGRFGCEIGTWPVAYERIPLHEFVASTQPLSERATAGFLARLSRSNLRRPRWFDERLAAHLRRMQQARHREQADGAKQNGSRAKSRAAAASATND